MSREGVFGETKAPHRCPGFESPVALLCLHIEAPRVYLASAGNTVQTDSPDSRASTHQQETNLPPAFLLVYPPHSIHLKRSGHQASHNPQSGEGGLRLCTHTQTYMFDWPHHLTFSDSHKLGHIVPRDMKRKQHQKDPNRPKGNTHKNAITVQTAIITGTAWAWARCVLPSPGTFLPALPGRMAARSSPAVLRKCPYNRTACPQGKSPTLAACDIQP